MLTDRGKALLVAAFALWLVSRMFGVPELGMAAVAVLALIALAVIYTMIGSTRLSARRSVHPPRLFYDAHGTVVLRVRNEGRLPTAILQVEDTAPGTIAEGGRFVLAPLASGATATMRYRLHGRQRGRFEVGPLHVRLRDPFGIAARQHRFGRTDEVVVYPPVWRLPPGIPLGGHQGPGGEGRPRPLATGEELANVRDYVRGDDLRKVHWRSTAHRGRLMIRQDESPQNPEATVVLDTRAVAHHGVGPASSFEQAVAAAASVAYHLSERSYAVRLVTQPVAHPPRALPWELVLEQLAVIAPGRTRDLGSLWQQLSQGVGGSGVLAAVVAVPDPVLLRKMVRAGRGFSSRIAVLVDTEGFGARRRRTLDVALTADALRAADWRVTVAARGDRLDERWRELIVQHRGRPVGAPGGSR